MEHALLKFKDRSTPQLLVTLKLYLELPDVPDICSVFALDFSIWSLIYSEVILLVYIYFGLFVRTIGSVQPATDSCSHCLILHAFHLSVYRHLHKHLGRRTVDKENNGSADFFILFLICKF